MISITDDNSLHILGFIEGPRWKQYQYTHKESEQGFFRLRELYLQLKAEFEEGGLNIADDPLNTSGMILYGEGGWSRYRIRSTGEIVLLASSTRAEKIETAKAYDITVIE